LSVTVRMDETAFGSTDIAKTRQYAVAVSTKTVALLRLLVSFLCRWMCRCRSDESVFFDKSLVDLRIVGALRDEIANLIRHDCAPRQSSAYIRELERWRRHLTS
jgi:hypothetical protein